MEAGPQRFTVGQAAVTVFNAGDIVYDLAENLIADEAVLRERYAAQVSAPLHLPMQCIHIQTPQAAVMVDAASYEMDADSPFRIAGYSPPAPLPEQMAAAGIDAGAVESLVITHAHWDHYNGLTVPAAGGGRMPICARAQVYMGKADWESAEMQAAVAAPETLQARTFGVVAQLGRLAPVAGRREIAPGIEIVPTPGETPGHVMVRVSSDGQTLYCVGDVYHHPIEAEQPGWAAPWADLESICAIREALAVRAPAEDALIIATHIRGAGRLRQTGEGMRWVEA
jgi:glyoxylase-like metal-dependent hydrolase (beta-lactamase superfamily II)